MIRPIRTVHRWAVLALSGLLPLLFAAGLAVRRAGPPASETRQLLGPDVLAYWSRFEPPGRQLHVLATQRVLDIRDAQATAGERGSIDPNTHRIRRS